MQDHQTGEQRVWARFFDRADPGEPFALEDEPELRDLERWRTGNRDATIPCAIFLRASFPRRQRPFGPA
jgi:hypothetical protein